MSLVPYSESITMSMLDNLPIYYLYVVKCVKIPVSSIHYQVMYNIIGMIKEFIYIKHLNHISLIEDNCDSINFYSLPRLKELCEKNLIYISPSIKDLIGVTDV